MLADAQEFRARPTCVLTGYNYFMGLFALRQERLHWYSFIEK